MPCTRCPLRLESKPVHVDAGLSFFFFFFFVSLAFQVRAMSAAMKSGPAKRVLSKVARKWTPTAVGLGIIPFIVHPIDEAVTWGMDETVRKWLA